MKTNYKIANFLITLRKENNLTQADLSIKLGVTEQAISKWETGKSLPEVDQLIAIADLYQVTVDELLAGRRAENSAESKSDSLITALVDQRRLSYTVVNTALGICIPAILLLFTFTAGYAWGFVSLTTFIVTTILNILFVAVYYLLLYFPGDKLPKNKFFQKLKYNKVADIIRVAISVIILVSYVGVFANLATTFIWEALSKFA